MSIEQRSGWIPVLFDSESIVLPHNEDAVLLELSSLKDGPVSNSGFEISLGREIYRARTPVVSDMVELGPTPQPERKQLPILRTFRPCDKVELKVFEDETRRDEAVAICKGCTIEQQCKEDTIAKGEYINEVRGGLRPLQIRRYIQNRRVQSS